MDNHTASTQHVRAPPTFDRTWIALLLTLQIFLGAALGIAVQALAVYVVIWWALPMVGLDLLEMAGAVAAPDWPGR
jgi:hypothetical protein